MEMQISLLDILWSAAGCMYLSDLHNLWPQQKARIVQALEQISASEVSLWDWNDALQYLTGKPNETTAEAARMQLIFELSQDRNYNFRDNLTTQSNR